MEQERNKLIRISGKRLQYNNFRDFYSFPCDGNRHDHEICQKVAFLQCLAAFEGTMAEGWLQHQDEWDSISLSASFSRPIFFVLVSRPLVLVSRPSVLVSGQRTNMASFGDSITQYLELVASSDGVHGVKGKSEVGNIYILQLMS